MSVLDNVTYRQIPIVREDRGELLALADALRWPPEIRDVLRDRHTEASKRSAELFEAEISRLEALVDRR